MELRQISYLAAVAEHQNFTRAAAALHISQPTLSQQIKALERSLKVQLLDRSGRTVRLTDAGASYLLYAHRARRELQAAQRAIHDVQDLRRGSLRLAMTPSFTSYLMGPLAEQFNARYPGIVLSVREMTQDSIEAALASDDLDLGVAFSKTRSADIAVQELFVEELQLVVGASHPGAENVAHFTPEGWDAQSLVLLSRDFSTRAHIDNYFQANGISPRISIEANSISAIVEIVGRGQLATVLPRAIAQHHPGLHSIPLTPAIAPRTAALLRRKGAYHSFAAKAFARMAMEWQH
ncbi:transcriptional regulator CynR [Arthrobacter sp. TMN-49]